MVYLYYSSSLYTASTYLLSFETIVDCHNAVRYLQSTLVSDIVYQCIHVL